MALRKWLRDADYAVREMLFDSLHHVETRKSEFGLDLTFSSGNATASAGYEASDDCVSRSILTALPIDYSQYTFIDIGSGKGKVLFLASTYPFRKIIGVEFAKELHEAAIRNIASYCARGPMRCQNIEPIHQDATAYRFPEGNLFVYFFNPASEEIIRQVMTNLDRAFTDSPRDIVVGYYNAKYAHLFSRFPNFRTAHKNDFFVVYRAQQ